MVGFAYMADAMEMMILSILGPALHCEWHITGKRDFAFGDMVKQARRLPLNPAQGTSSIVLSMRKEKVVA